MFGLAPALHIAKTDVNEILKEGGRSGSAGMRVRRWGSALVVAELALTLVLLAGAGFMMRNFMTMYRLDIGVETSRLLTMSLSLPDAKYPALEQRLAFYQQLQERLGSRVQAVAVASHAPMQGGFTRRLEIDGQPPSRRQEPPTVTMLAIDPRYFETLGAQPGARPQLHRGRRWPGQESAIINTRLAQMHFGDRRSDRPADRAEPRARWAIRRQASHARRRSPIVGVVAQCPAAHRRAERTRSDCVSAVPIQHPRGDDARRAQPRAIRSS